MLPEADIEPANGGRDPEAGPLDQDTLYQKALDRRHARSEFLFGVRFGRLHNCSGNLILEKDEHPVVPRKTSIDLCDQVVHAPSSDVDLPAVSVRDELEVQSRLGANDFLNEQYRRLHTSRISPKG
ncbi:MAG: hypothetical protein WBW51_10745 [Methyloceanibacter sp.]